MEGVHHHAPVILFILGLTYAGIALGHVPGLKIDRTGIALLGAISMLIFGGISTADAVAYVNWPTIYLLFGFFVISAQLRLSGFYHLVAGGISAELGHPARFLFILMAATAGLSAFLNHDIVCFVFTPIVGLALIKGGFNPVPFLIGLAVASNIGAAATVIGNPQDMMIAQVAHLGFGPYLVWSVVPVLVALACAYGIIWLMSSRHLRSEGNPPEASVPPDYPVDKAHMAKGLVLLALVIVLFFSPLPKEVVALAAAGIHLASPKFRTSDLLGLIDWSVLVLFIGLFVVTGAFASTGYGDDTVRWLAHAGVSLDAPAVLIPATTILSNIINNSAAVMLLLKVVDLSHPVTAYTLALANSFGGSLLVIGSVSNILVVQQAQRCGIAIGFGAFVRLGIPVTLAALAGLGLWVSL